MEALLARLGGFSERLMLDVEVPPGAIPAVAYANPEFMRETLTALAERYGARDLCLVASLWHKHYNSALLSGILAAMTLGGIGLDGSTENVAVVLRNGLPRSICLYDRSGALAFRPRSGQTYGLRQVEGLEQLRRFVLERVLAEHTAGVVDRLNRLTGLSRRILWGNVGNLIADLYDTFADEMGARAVATADRLVLMGRVKSPYLKGRNPLFGTVAYHPVTEPGLPMIVRVRKTCCQRRLLPGMKPCTTCPMISMQERAALLRRDL